MTISRLSIVLTVVNFAMLVATLGGYRPLAAREIAPVLRGRALEIVDDGGRVRASLTVLPPATSARGDKSPETVLLRLITERGRPSVKIAASEEAAGLSFAGPSNTRDTYTILQSKGTISSLKLRNEDGREQMIEPASDRAR
jgi:hypothetical protein